ncbi:hypothetical protein [Acholeplasma hippikon]|uniref:Uncharacterized protein n=1 Tax=Acholeplasma hippikon TaxID=264636 RepID=A0A449BIA6_9MOLU|nr:hypothetical protein [Acholeplasma hippikon]VEU82170.1 Uncharacterised protein [Acholeplasma hippikon]
MNVKQYLETNKPEKYIICDRMRVTLKEEQLKWLNLEDLDIRHVDTLSDGTVRIQTDYMPDGC